MANRFRGFARMLSTAKNSTRKEGSGRMFSSTAQESPKVRMKNTSGDINYEDRGTTRNFYLNVSKGASVGFALGGVYGYFVYGWYPFKGTLEGDRSQKPWGAARDSADMNLSHSRFYNRDIQERDVKRKAEVINKRAFDQESKLEKALELVDELAYEELDELINCARRKRKQIVAWRAHDKEIEELFRIRAADANIGVGVGTDGGGVAANVAAPNVATP